MTTMMPEAEEVVDTREQASTGDGEHDLFAHYAPKDEIDASWLTGTPVTALCGKKWIPTRDPEKYPVCGTCKDLLAQKHSDG